MSPAELGELLPEGWTTGEVLGRRDWTPELFTLTVAAAVAPFEPGQFLRLGLARDEHLLSRAYSVASAPGAPLEFYVALVQDGALTPALHALAPGEALAVTVEAAGHFTLAHLPDAEQLWLVATGTGLAPYLSMLRTEEPWRRFGRVILVHGVRLHADLAYADELRALAASRGLVYLPLVTREPPREGVIGGRIPARLAELEARAGAPLDPARSQVMLCGNPDMVEEMEALLAARGLHRHHKGRPGNVTAERYW